MKIGLILYALVLLTGRTIYTTYDFSQSQILMILTRLTIESDFFKNFEIVLLNGDSNM